jgi:hypothetical protein
MLEQRVQRIEQVLNLPPIDKADSPTDDHDDDDEPMGMGMGPPGPARMDPPRMEPPRFKLGGHDLTEFHGETSMHDDGKQSITDPSPPVQHPSVDGWSPAEMRNLRRLRHKYATPDEGEAYIDAYFFWASTTTGVVNRAIFLRE